MKETAEEETSALSLAYLERLQADYARDPRSVPAQWRTYFDEMFAGANGAPRAAPGPTFRRHTIFNPAPAEAADAPAAHLQCLIEDLVHAFRVRGHLMARIDPLGRPVPQVPELDPAHYGLRESDLDRPLVAARSPAGERPTLRMILGRLRNTYCRSIGVQFMHIDDLAVRTWLQERMESTENRLKLPPTMQSRILTRLTDAVLFEEFVRKKYLGAKTFSLEGSETLIPLLDLAIEKAASQGVVEVVLGMAHRGRLNVLANVIGKRMQDIFWEFRDADSPEYLRGDVRFHLGHSSDWTTESGRRVHLSLCFNPSHLEFVNPVALGRMRAKLERTGGKTDRGLVILIHGDASFAGEGVVQESFNLSELPAYTVGGALHVIVNNQIGFTTPPEEGRSSDYATAVAKMLHIPIFHVNGEDPEAAAQVIDLALDFRHRYHRDVVIDLYGYRRWGHNEGDEPSFTQPVMYRAIERRASVRDSYLKNLLEAGELTREEADRIADERRRQIESEFASSQAPEFKPPVKARGGFWQGYLGGPEPADDIADTALPADQITKLLKQLTEAPAEFHLHPKLERLWQARRAMADGERPLDWSTAEALAIASLAAAGQPVRMSGQDSERGTFSQRHAVLHDHEDGHTFCPLDHLAEKQAAVNICNSPLSESGALGFEYGYSLDYPESLVIWEAQYGDFCNAAQVIIDQFITSAEQKWHRLSGLVLLLPHGFEGQGPEHSSARLERFLLLAAGHNMQVVQPSTPAQYFHCLRRQVLRRWRKPLVVLTPKSLLRNPAMASDMAQFTTGRFERVLPDARPKCAGSVSRVLLSSGKMYYELAKAREDLNRQDVGLVRIEQFYPLPLADLSAVLDAYPDGTPAFWVQEEPANMGAWQYLRMHLGHAILDRLPMGRISRAAASSPATGSRRIHHVEQEAIVAEAFGELKHVPQPSADAHP